jgi:hypothetical protein
MPIDMVNRYGRLSLERDNASAAALHLDRTRHEHETAKSENASS